MKIIQTSIIAGFAFLLSTGISFGAELDDLDFSIRVVETDDVSEVHNELSLPGMASGTAREHAENEGEHGSTQANEARHQKSDSGDEHEQENEVEHELDDQMEARDEREDAVEDNDEMREDSSDTNEEYSEAEHEEAHDSDFHQEMSGGQGGADVVPDAEVPE
jgi:hypothetical protein